MDNKRVYKRISTCFWFMLATSPIWYLLIGSLIGFLAHTDGLTTTASIFDLNIKFFLLNFFNNNISQFFQPLIPSILQTTFRNLFQSFDISSSSSLILSTLFGWFCWVYFIELMCDFIIWLPRLFHSWMERWCRD